MTIRVGVVLDLEDERGELLSSGEVWWWWWAVVEFLLRLRLRRKKKAIVVVIARKRLFARSLFLSLSLPFIAPASGPRGAS